MKPLEITFFEICAYIKIDNKVVCYKDFADKKLIIPAIWGVEILAENNQSLSVNPKTLL